MGVFDGSYERQGVARFGLGLWLGRVIGPHLTEPEIRRREMAIPLQKAELGAQTIEEGLDTDDKVLGWLGAAMVTAAYLEAEDTQRIVVPPDISEGVNLIAASLQPEDVTGNPYISPYDASKVSTIMRETGLY